MKETPNPTGPITAGEAKADLAGAPPGLFANRFLVAVGPAISRLYFIDAAVDLDGRPHTALVMTTHNLIDLADLINDQLAAAKFERGIGAGLRPAAAETDIILNPAALRERQRVLALIDHVTRKRASGVDQDAIARQELARLRTAVENGAHVVDDGGES